MSSYVMPGLAGLLAAWGAAWWIGRRRERRVAEILRGRLGDAARSGSRIESGRALPGDLPAPVARYLQRVLPQGVRPIERAWLRQSGKLRTSTSSGTWLEFEARQFVVPAAPGFVWSARVRMPLGTHIRVLDSYCFGAGSGRVSVLSAVPVAAVSDEPELNSGALHRYLAEAVWYPTALLPRDGLSWEAAGERAAVATLTDRGITVSLEFRFNEDDEVVAVHTPGRYERVGRGYRKTPWEGHFSQYAERGGIWVPTRGEVGWYADGELQLVWKGRVDSLEYHYVD